MYNQSKIKWLILCSGSGGNNSICSPSNATSDSWTPPLSIMRSHGPLDFLRISLFHHSIQFLKPLEPIHPFFSDKYLAFNESQRLDLKHRGFFADRRYVTGIWCDPSALHVCNIITLSLYFPNSVPHTCERDSEADK